MLGRELVEIFGKSHELALWDRDEIDIADKADVEKKITDLNPDAIINAAAYTAVDDAETNNEIAYKVNGYALGYISKVCKELNSLLVHFSTDYVFSGSGEQGYKEDDVASSPMNEYGKSKLLGEKMITDINPKFYLVRTAWLFGKSGKNFVETMIKLASEKGGVKVVNDQIGSPTYAKDLAMAVKDLIEKKKPYGIYHITNSGYCSWFEFATEIFRQAGMKVNITPVASDHFPTPAKRPRYSVLLNTKLPELRPWKEALRDYLAETGRIDK